MFPTSVNVHVGVFHSPTPNTLKEAYARACDLITEYLCFLQWRGRILILGDFNSATF